MQAESTSPLLAPPPSDVEDAVREPESYLGRSVPGRVFQSASPAPDVPVLVTDGSSTLEVAQGGSCLLAVRVPAGAMATFTTFDLGLFDNGLASISVRSGADGLARARFTAAGEVIGEVHILAGSPAASGQVAFTVGVRPAGVPWTPPGSLTATASGAAPGD